MTVQELFNDIPLWQVAHILPHEAAQISPNGCTKKRNAAARWSTQRRKSPIGRRESGILIRFYRVIRQAAEMPPDED